MLIDLSLKVKGSFLRAAIENEKFAPFGHVGTHFDVMDKEFPLEFTKRKAIVFDVSNVKDRDIQIEDIDTDLVKSDMFVAFYSGFINRVRYGSKEYISKHPQLTDELIDLLLDRGVSIIGIDFAGVRRGRGHGREDRYCADRGVFIIENLTNLDQVLNNKKSAEFICYTFPMNLTNLTGLPCRVVAEVE